MLELLIVILVILWLLGYFGPVRVPAIPRNAIHFLLVLIFILLIIRLLR